VKHRDPPIRIPLQRNESTRVAPATGSQENCR
jgi:hypothetical protein